MENVCLGQNTWYKGIEASHAMTCSGFFIQPVECAAIYGHRAAQRDVKHLKKSRRVKNIRKIPGATRNYVRLGI